SWRGLRERSRKGANAVDDRARCVSIARSRASIRWRFVRNVANASSAPSALAKGAINKAKNPMHRPKINASEIGSIIASNRLLFERPPL
ncbi:MAG: hypothetical protein WAK85_10210, partial [Xanthobacteraceae bacterium]